LCHHRLCAAYFPAYNDSLAVRGADTIPVDDIHPVIFHHHVSFLPHMRRLMRLAAPVLAVFITLLAPPAMAEVKFERKLREGAKETAHIETSTKQVLSLAGMDIETRATQFMIATSQAGQRASDGVLPIVSQIDKLQADISLPGGVSLAFDSGAPDKQPDNPLLEPLLKLLRASAKSKWTTLFDKENQVKSVEFDKSLADSVDDAYKSQFDPERRKKTLMQELAALPDKPVSKGDSWTRTVESDLGSGQLLTVENRYEYLGTETVDGKVLEKIGITTTDVSFSQDQNANTPAKVISSELKVSESSGAILFDRDKGAALRTSSKLRIQGSLKLSINGMEFPGKLDLTLETKNTVQP
jgi:Family of unknown function (DUF6263)